MEHPCPSPISSVSGCHGEASYVAWVRASQQQARRRAALLSTLVAHADPSEAADNRGQAMAWAERHAHDRRRDENSMAQLRLG